MYLHLSQIYVEQGACFPFSHLCMKYLDEQISESVAHSEKFTAKYGEDWDLIFRISAKHALQENEIRGPTVFKKDKDVEYTIFLPYKVITNEPNPPQAALDWMFCGVYEVFARLEIDAGQVQSRQQEIVEHILSNPAMFEDLKYVKIYGSDTTAERIGYEHLDPEVWKAR